MWTEEQPVSRNPPNPHRRTAIPVRWYSVVCWGAALRNVVGARLGRVGTVLCAFVMCVGALASCQVVVTKAAPAAAIGIARILIEQDGKITLEQATSIVVTELVGAAVDEVAPHAKPARRMEVDSPAPGPEPEPSATGEAWTIVVRQDVEGVARTNTFRVSSGEKLHVLTNGKTVQTFEPGKSQITIEARPGTSTAIAVVDSLDEPKRSSGKFRLLAVGNNTDYDFDNDKRSGGSDNSDLHMGLGSLSAANGAVYAKYRDSGDPTLADCVTVRPDEWRTGFGNDRKGKWCMRTSEGRYGTLKMSGDVVEYSYTVWETATAAPVPEPAEAR